MTTIGPAHLERLGALEGVFAEKSAVVRAVPPSGLVVLGDDHAFVADLERATRAPVVKVTGRGIAMARSIVEVICRHLAVPEVAIVEALRDFQPPKGRLTRIALRDLTLLDDSYNANPLSMRLGLDTLAAEQGRRIAILGPMAELGMHDVRYHQEIGAHARSSADLVIGWATSRGTTHLITGIPTAPSVQRILVPCSLAAIRCWSTARHRHRCTTLSRRSTQPPKPRADRPQACCRHQCEGAPSANTAASR